MNKPKPHACAMSEDTLVEAKVQLALQAFKNGKFKSVRAAATFYEAPYHRTLSRSKDHRPVSENGGRHTALNETEDGALHAAMHRLVLLGSRVSTHHLWLTANEILQQRCEPGKEPRKVNKRWARRYMARNRHLFKRAQAIRQLIEPKLPSDPSSLSRSRRNSV